MNRTVVSAAIAAAFAGIGGQAQALSPASFDTTTTNELYISGATAQRPQLLGLMRRVCNVGTLDYYTSGTNLFAYFCTVNPATVPGLVKPNLVVYKTDVGGSGNGVQPVANAATLQFMDMATIKAATTLCGATSTVAAVTVSGDTLGLPAYTARDCSSAFANKLTEVGFSDVEPQLFGATTAEVAKLAPNIFSSNALTFGVPVTKNLRDALQTAQGLTTGSETEANMPSLTDTQVAAIYSGQITTWDQFANTAGVVLTPVDNNIYVARRVVTSGTQTSARVYFLNNPCATGVLNFVDGNDTRACNTLTTGTLGTVFEGSGSGNVVSCLNRHNTDGRWAVGVLSTEFSDSVASGNGFRFVKLNGKSPKLLNVIQGKYRYWMETTIQWRNGTPGPALGGDDLTFMNKVVALIGEPPVLQAINSGFLHDWVPSGGAGLLSLPSNFTPAFVYTTDAQAIDNPINTHTKAPLGNPVNCQPPVAVFPTVVSQ